MAPTEVAVLPAITLTTPAGTKSSLGKVVIPESKWRSETKLGNSLAVECSCSESSRLAHT